MQIYPDCVYSKISETISSIWKLVLSHIKQNGGRQGQMGNTQWLSLVHVKPNYCLSRLTEGLGYALRVPEGEGCPFTTPFFNLSS